MSNETQTTEEPKLVAPVIERNGVKLALKEQKLGKLSKHKLATFFAPEIDVSNPDHVTWYGVADINFALKQYSRKVFAGIYIDNAEDANGKVIPLNYDAWLLDAQDFTAGADTLADLNENVSVYVAEQQDLIQNENFGAEGEVGDKIGNRLKELSDLIRPLRAKIAQIKDKYKAIAAKRAETEKNSETKTPAPATVAS